MEKYSPKFPAASLVVQTSQFYDLNGGFNQAWIAITFHARLLLLVCLWTSQQDDGQESKRKRRRCCQCFTVARTNLSLSNFNFSNSSSFFEEWMNWVVYIVWWHRVSSSIQAIAKATLSICRKGETIILRYFWGLERGEVLCDGILATLQAWTEFLSAHAYATYLCWGWWGQSWVAGMLYHHMMGWGASVCQTL